ncbi:MAG: Rieske (2Fe-2S) protein [Chloroflexi bacterium]|nr:Rieske (2Fe-2S) protein [Chloroflexota bacterium]
MNKEENDRLTQVGPGTPMGELLRRYWHPVAAASQLAAPGTRLVKLLGETLVLFRDRQDRLGLVGFHCAHRSAGLLYGVPEEEGLRCSYHGWMYDTTGQCIAQPFEQTVDPESLYHERIRIPAYPVQELGGMVFAYLGPEPAPLIPHWDIFLRDDVAKDIGIGLIPCNWLQIMENSADPQHSEWLHTHLDNYTAQRLGRRERPKRQLVHEDVGFDQFEYGILKRRQRGGVSKEHEMWSLGHPLVFPLAEKAGRSAQPVMFIRVPIDDTHTVEYSYRYYRDIPKTRDVPPWYEVPTPPLENNGEPPYEHMSAIFVQDVLMWYSQGDVTNRGNEHLGRGDMGVVLYRRLLEESLRKLERGEDPMNVFRDPAKNVCIDLPVEDDKALRGPWKPDLHGGGTSMHSPIVAEYLDSLGAAASSGTATRA